MSFNLGLNTGKQSYTIEIFGRLMRVSGMLPLRELFCRRLGNKTKLNYVVSTHKPESKEFDFHTYISCRPSIPPRKPSTEPFTPLP